ncbi:MAG: TolC family protein [Methylocella sp.]
MTSGLRSQRALAIALGLAATGCAKYERLPLDTSADLVSRSDNLVGGVGGRVSLRMLDQLVVANNPDLRAARAQLGAADAQVLIAGILPNPQLQAAYPFLISGPGTVDSYSAGFVQDLKSILIYRTKGEVASAAKQNVSATLLWQEWQTIGKARLLYVDIVSGDRLLTFIAKTRKLFKERFDLTSKAITEGNATVATLSPDLVAVGDIQKTYDDLSRLQLSRRHQLAALLGLTPDAPFALSPTIGMPRIDVARIRAELGSIADRRPDLIALQFGYRSEDAKLRQAILSQFPAISVGLFAGQDTSGILAIGPQINTELPIFDRNQGGVALETATREQLRREFTARVTAATEEVEALLSEQALVGRQLMDLEPRLRQARAIAERTEIAFRQGIFDERAYVDIESARLAREQERITLLQAQLEGQVALATLVGAGFPFVTLSPEEPPADPLGLFHEVAR